jgi:hypothetical protein
MSDAAKRFYARAGFHECPVDPMMMMITLAEVEKNLSPPSASCTAVAVTAWSSRQSEDCVAAHVRTFELLTFSRNLRVAFVRLIDQDGHTYFAEIDEAELAEDGIRDQDRFESARSRQEDARQSSQCVQLLLQRSLQLSTWKSITDSIAPFLAPLPRATTER